MTDDDDRFAALERRIEQLERAVASRAEAPARAPEVKPPAVRVGPTPMRPDPSSAPPVIRTAPKNWAPQILGISGVAALVLAASYLVRLAIDSGWLTPERQIGIAAVAGVVMILGGLRLRGTGRKYASLLASSGLTVLFLTVYGAHLYHELIGATAAMSAVAVLCLVALWLGRVFHAELYALLAVVGAYSTPMLVRTDAPDLAFLALYGSAWSLLFSVYSLVLGGRLVYLTASLMALVSFDLAWAASGGAEWQVAVSYRGGLFLLFTAVTSLYSVKQRSPLTRLLAGAHAPSLLLFYAVEYWLLDAHLTQWAPWIALSSAAVVVSAYRLTRSRLEGTLAGAELTSWYAALVLFHAGYLELVPTDLQPWLALGLFIGLGVWRARGGALDPVRLPLLLAGGLICVLNYGRMLAGSSSDTMDGVPLAAVLYVAYTLVLYAAYALTSARDIGRVRPALLYAAHVTAMVTVDRLIDASVMVSVLWGAIAIGSLLLAVRNRDRTLAQSSFLVFAISGIKVLLIDLEGSAPLVRIGCLVVLGLTLYAGGWLYQRLDRD